RGAPTTPAAPLAPAPHDPSCIHLSLCCHILDHQPHHTVRATLLRAVGPADVISAPRRLPHRHSPIARLPRTPPRHLDSTACRRVVLQGVESKPEAFYTL